MNCKETILELSAYLDNEVSDTTRVSIETHVASCTSCRARLLELQRISHGIAALPALPASVDIADNVRRRIRADDTLSRSSSWWEWLTSPAWLKLPVHAVALVALLIGIAMLVRPNRDQPQKTAANCMANMKQFDVAQQYVVTAPSNIPVLGADKETDHVVAADELQPETKNRITEDNRPILRGPPTPASPPASVEIADAGRRDLNLAKQKVAEPELVVPSVMEVASLDIALVQQQVALLAAELNGQLVTQPSDDRPGVAFAVEEKIAGEKAAKKDVAPAVIQVDLPADKLDQFKTSLNQRIEVASRDRKTVTEGRESFVAGSTIGAGATAAATPPPPLSSTVRLESKAQSGAEAKDLDEPAAARLKRAQQSKGEAAPAEPRTLLDSTRAMQPVIASGKPAESTRIMLIIKVVPPSPPLP